MRQPYTLNDDRLNDQNIAFWIKYNDMHQTTWEEKNEWFFVEKSFYTLPDWSLFTLSSISFMCFYSWRVITAIYLWWHSFFFYKYFEWQFIHSNEYYRQLNAYLNVCPNGCQNIQQKLHNKAWQHTRLM